MVLNETIPGLLPLQSGGARRTLDKLIEKHGTKLFNCFEAGYSTFGGIQSIIFLPPLHKFAEIDPNDATRPVTINRVVYRIAKLKTFRTLPETAQTAPNFFLYKFIEELVQHFDYGVGMTGVEPPEFSSNFPGLDNPTKTKYDNDCFALLEITCRLYSIFYITIYAQQDLCLENNMRSGLYSRYVENRTTQPQFSVFMDEIIHALQSGESLQCLFGQNETNRDALEVLLEMMLEHGLLYTAAKLGLPIEKIKTLTGTRFFTGTTDFLEKVMAKFPVVEGAPLPPPLPPSPPIPSTPPTSPTSPTSPPPPPPPAVIPTEDQISAVLEGLLYSTDEGLTWTRIPQSKVTEFIGGADKSLNITSEIVNTVLRHKGEEFGIPLVIFDDTNIVSKDLFDGPYNVLGDGWCFYYAILEQFDIDNMYKQKENSDIKNALITNGGISDTTKRNTPQVITRIKEILLLDPLPGDSREFLDQKKQWKDFYNSQPGKNYDTYIDSLDNKTTKPWADPEYGIGQFIATLLNTDINIYQTTADGSYINLQKYTSLHNHRAPGRPIHILYINRNHYQILLPKTGAVVPAPPPAVNPTEEQITAVLKALLYSTGEGLTWTRIPQSQVTEFIGGADKSLNITSEIVNTVLRDKGKKFGIPLVIFDDTINIISKDRFDRPYNILANQWCFYYSILEQFDVDRKVRKENTVIKARLDGQTNVTPNTKRDTPNFIKSIKEALQDKKLYANEKEQWKLFYESQPGKKYDEYIASLDDARTKPWADPEYGIGQVIANKFRANINIYQTKTDGNYINLQTYTPKEVQMQDPVHILYINRNHYQILLPKTGAVVPAPPPSPVSDTFTLKIEKGEIYPTRLHFTDTLDNINPYRTKILLKQESTGIPAPNGWAAIEKRFIPNQIYLRKINTMDYLTKNAEASWTEISKLFTPTNYIAINEVTMEFIDRGEHTSTNEANWVRRSRPRDSYGYKNPAAAERSKSGGTRKRHHSYPLKHTFKNRRA